MRQLQPLHPTTNSLKRWSLRRVEGFQSCIHIEQNNYWHAKKNTVPYLLAYEIGKIGMKQHGGL